MTEQSNENAGEEREADLFAAHLLMPNSEFVSEWRETSGLPMVDRVLKVKRIFRVSYKTVLFRLIENKEQDRSVWQLFQVRYRDRHGCTLRMAEEPDALDETDFFGGRPVASRAEEPEKLSDVDFQEDRHSRLVRSAFQNGLISMGYAAECLDVSRSEMRALAREWVGGNGETKH